VSAHSSTNAPISGWPPPSDPPRVAVPAPIPSVLPIATRRAAMRISDVYRPGAHTRDAAINLRALPEQRDLIDEAARLLGKTRSDYMLEAACDKARSVYAGCSSTRSMSAPVASTSATDSCARPSTA
jgi:hypothetical protein